ncbi:N-acetylmuramoyl-L-alanine amidase family protein [Mycobacterium xenopi 4042]|uniref:N-acetylmuramoyl-L-alanine amidase family protein n=1 Tax=Mycobacterium xenopi 4042 TaxID=1299334 RepID=X8DKT4_MYCXE|nr:N-acetylmuramoyl-L-alanine amidase family protein [Mycobacterium xenopi 4042]
MGTRSHRGDAPSRPASTHLTQQPLVGLGGGVTVREITQSTPFSMVALTGGDLTGTSARVRAKHADGSWGPGMGPKRSSREAPTERRGTTRSARHRAGVRRHHHDRADRRYPPPDAPTTSPPPKHAPAGLGYLPATAEQPLAQNISAVLISPPRARRIPSGLRRPRCWHPASLRTSSAGPVGADESIRCGNTMYDNGIHAAIVHHTAGSNDYAPEDSAEIVRAIYAYHTQTLGWCDIAYNALVDKYGQVFEGRAGGITKAVEGSHTGGFNRGTWGVAMIGDFNDVPPTSIQLRTVGRLIGWRLGLDRVNPKGAATLASAGGPFTRFRAVPR